MHTYDASCTTPGAMEGGMGQVHSGTPSGREPRDPSLIAKREIESPTYWETTHPTPSLWNNGGAHEESES